MALISVSGKPVRQRYSPLFSVLSTRCNLSWPCLSTRTDDPRNLGEEIIAQISVATDEAPAQQITIIYQKNRQVYWRPPRAKPAQGTTYRMLRTLEQTSLSEICEAYSESSFSFSSYPLRSYHCYSILHPRRSCRQTLLDLVPLWQGALDMPSDK